MILVAAPANDTPFLIQDIGFADLQQRKLGASCWLDFQGRVMNQKKEGHGGGGGEREREREKKKKKKKNFLYIKTDN